jgi:hypothetical protein
LGSWAHAAGAGPPGPRRRSGARARTGDAHELPVAQPHQALRDHGGQLPQRLLLLLAQRLRRPLLLRLLPRLRLLLRLRLLPRLLLRLLLRLLPATASRRMIAHQRRPPAPCAC